MQAIHVKYISATESKGSRIKATASAGSITISYPHELSGQAVYRKAAEELIKKLEWDTESYKGLLGGCLPDGSYCFVFDNDSAKN